MLPFAFALHAMIELNVLFIVDFVVTEVVVVVACHRTSKIAYSLQRAIKKIKINQAK